MESMNELIAHFGSQVKMATALGVTQGAISQWVSGGGLPAGRAVQVEIMTKGEFRAIDIVAPNEKEDV